jgi:hypothetical protein
MTRDPDDLSSGRRLILIVSAAFVVIFLWGFFQFAYDRGTRDAALEFAERSDCRAELAVVLNKAERRQQAAFGLGLVAALAADDPGVQARLRELADQTPDEVFREQVLQIIDRSVEIREAQEEQGDPVKRCADGDPDN